jgi:hypothetical protein
MKQTNFKKELKENNRFLKDLVESLEDIKKGRIQNFKFPKGCKL